jgi:hypothetical protein
MQLNKNQNGTFDIPFLNEGVHPQDFRIWTIDTSIIPSYQSTLETLRSMCQIPFPYVDEREILPGSTSKAQPHPDCLLKMLKVPQIGIFFTDLMLHFANFRTPNTSCGIITSSTSQVIRIHYDCPLCKQEHTWEFTLRRFLPVISGLVSTDRDRLIWFSGRG